VETKPAAPHEPAKSKSVPTQPAGSSPRDSTVQRALNALAACAESLVDQHAPGPGKETCRIQLDEAKRLIASLEAAEARAPSPSREAAPPHRARG
jgi:hypothetical protein